MNVPRPLKTELAIISRPLSVRQTRSTPLMRFSRPCACSASREEIVSMVTSGLRFWICDFAASTLFHLINTGQKKIRTKVNTFFPTSSSRKKNPAPRSSGETVSGSATTNLPIPAKTMFLIVSVAVPFSVMIRIAAFRILCRCTKAPQLSDEVGIYAWNERGLLTFVELLVPIDGFDDHKPQLHLCLTRQTRRKWCRRVQLPSVMLTGTALELSPPSSMMFKQIQSENASRLVGRV